MNLAMNWTLQLLSHNSVFLFRLLTFGKLTSILLLYMHLKSSVSSPEPADFSHLLAFKLYTRPKCALLQSTAPTFGVVLRNPLSVFLAMSNPKPFVSSTILTLTNRSNLFPIVVQLDIFPSFTDTLTNGHCSQEIRDIIPVPLKRVRTTRSSTHSHPFQVSLPNPRTLSHKSSFIPRTCNLWNILPSSCFPESYNLPSFKSNVNRLDLISLSSQLLTFFFLPMLGRALYRSPWPFLNITH